MSSIFELGKALSQANQVFSVDFDTARELASQHNDSPVTGYLFDQVVPGGKYQPRIPSTSAEEENSVADSRSLTVACMDRRQIYQAVAKLGVNSRSDAKLVIAGGAAFTNTERAEAAKRLVVAYHQVNPEGQINLVAHTGRCGGIVKYAGIGFYDQLQSGGGWDGKWENEAVAWLVNDFRYHLVTAGVSATAINMYITHLVGEEYKGMTQIRS